MIIRIEYHTALQCNNQQSLSQGHPSHRRRHGNRRHDTTVAMTTATTTVATTHSHVAAPTTLAFKSHAGRQLCSPVLLKSHAGRRAGSAQKPRCSAAMLDNTARQLHVCRFLLLRSYSFGYCAHILCDNQPTCLFDNCPTRQPKVFVSTTAIRQTIMANGQANLLS
jgi:hypothetical protein